LVCLKEEELTEGIVDDRAESVNGPVDDSLYTQFTASTAAEPPDRVTVLRCKTTQHRATKRFERQPDGSIRKYDYDCGYLYICGLHPVRNARELYKLLRRKVLRDHRTFLVRGTPRDDLKRTTRDDGVVVLNELIRKAVKPDGKEPAPGFVRRYTRYCMFDCDGYQLPPGLDPVKTTDDALVHITTVLPPEFTGLSMILHWSASTGFGEPGIAKFHLFVMLEEPYPYEQLRDYILAADGPIRFDPQPCTAVQPNYGAAPSCDGVEDPLPLKKRMVFIPGTRDRFVLPPAPVVERKLRERATKAGVTVEQLRNLPVGLRAKLQVMGDGDGRHGFNAVLVAAAASYVAARGQDDAAFKAMARRAIHAAPKRAGRGADIERYLSDQYLDECLMSARAKFKPETFDAEAEFDNLGGDDEPAGDGLGPVERAIARLLEGGGTDSEDLDAAIAVLVNGHPRNVLHEDEFVALVADHLELPQQVIRDRIEAAHQRRGWVDSGPKLEIKLSVEHLVDQLDTVERHLRERDVPLGQRPVFAWGESLSIIRKRPPLTARQLIESQDGTGAAQLLVDPLDVDTLREQLCRSVRFFKFDNRPRKWVQCLPSPEFLRMLLKRKGHGVRRLTGVQDVPAILPDGTLVKTPGYDRLTGLYLHLEAGAYDHLAEHPTREEAEAAWLVGSLMLSGASHRRTRRHQSQARASAGDPGRG
jgi:hypothetical protein